jgi:hypothetical protein
MCASGTEAQTTRDRYLDLLVKCVWNVIYGSLSAIARYT